jgi:acylpyruvate hydrolase
VKVICVGQNYRAHLQEMKGDEVVVPTLFAKLPETIIGDGDAIRLPPESAHVDAEAELAIVIGKTIRRVSRERAL